MRVNASVAGSGSGAGTPFSSIFQHHDRVQRRAQLVTYVGEETGYVIVGDGELAAFLIDLPEQARIGHGEDRLMRKRPDQTDHPFREVARCAAQYDESAQQLVLADQRHQQYGVEARRQRHELKRVCAGFGDVGNANRHIAVGGEAQGPIVRIDRHLARRVLKFLTDATRLGERELARTVILVDRRRVGLGEFDRTIDDRGEHQFGIERSGDGAADLLQRLELKNGLPEFARALFDLLFEGAVGDLQLVGHAVELLGQILDLVAGPHVEPVAEVAGLELLSSGLQRQDGGTTIRRASSVPKMVASPSAPASSQAVRSSMS